MMYRMRIIILLFFFTILNGSQADKFYFVTVANDRYFELLLNLIGSIHRSNFDKLGQIAVFDLGMSSEHLELLQKIQKVSVHQIEMTHPDLLKPFNTRYWGKPVPGWYAWKPVIIKQALDLFPEILFVDAGVTVYQPLDLLFDHIKTCGYFLHNGADWWIAKETTQYVIKNLHLDSDENKWILEPSQFALEANIMGFSRRVYKDLVEPLYILAHNLDYFRDEGTCPGGFGDARPEQSLFSIYATLHHLKIHHHFEKPCDPFYITTSKGVRPFHIACNKVDVTSDTALYVSRFDSNLAYFGSYIRWIS